MKEKNPIIVDGFAVYYCERCNRYTDVRYLYDKKKGDRLKSYCYRCGNEMLIPCNVQFAKDNQTEIGKGK